MIKFFHWQPFLENGLARHTLSIVVNGHILVTSYFLVTLDVTFKFQKTASVYLPYK